MLRALHEAVSSDNRWGGGSIPAVERRAVGAQPINWFACHRRNELQVLLNARSISVDVCWYPRHRGCQYQKTGGDTLRRIIQIIHLRNVATQAPWRSEERTLVCWPVDLHPILPRPNALSLSRRLKRVWAKSIWNGDTHATDSREERLVLYWLSYTTMFTEMLMKRDWTALFIQMPAHVRVNFQRNGNVLFSKYSVLMWSSCPCHGSIISGPFFTCKTPLQRRWFTPPINYNMEYGQRLLLRLVMILAHSRL